MRKIVQVQSHRSHRNERAFLQIVYDFTARPSVNWLIQKCNSNLCNFLAFVYVVTRLNFLRGLCLRSMHVLTKQGSVILKTKLKGMIGLRPIMHQPGKFSETDAIR